jgi:hypothetical protein
MSFIRAGNPTNGTAFSAIQFPDPVLQIPYTIV